MEHSIWKELNSENSSKNINFDNLENLFTKTSPVDSKQTSETKMDSLPISMSSEKYKSLPASLQLQKEQHVKQVYLL